jgi:hypothetical protein
LNQQVLSDGWYAYFGFRIPANRITCDGCMTEDGKRIDQACPVRPCVIQGGLATCAECDDYGCEKLAQRWVVYEQVAAQADSPVPEEDRERFIRPYENKARLSALRSERT